MTSKQGDSPQFNRQGDEYLPVRHDGSGPGAPLAMLPVGNGLGMNSPAARLEALFSSAGPLDLSSDEDVTLSSAAALVSADRQRQLLTFSLNSEEYALDIGSIREIIKPREITEIPRVPDHILGILSLRGQVIPVYDLKRRLKLGQGLVTPSARIIVCQHGELVAGLLVDSITQVVRIVQDGVEATPAHMGGIDRNLLLGVGRCQGRFLILLNLPSIIDAGMN
jgi:purine-binding chemotaxis protein CheW